MRLALLLLPLAEASPSLRSSASSSRRQHQSEDREQSSHQQPYTASNPKTQQIKNTMHAVGGAMSATLVAGSVQSAMNGDYQQASMQLSTAPFPYLVAKKMGKMFEHDQALRAEQAKKDRPPPV